MRCETIDEGMAHGQEKALILMEGVFVTRKVLCVPSFNHHSKSPVKPGV